MMSLRKVCRSPSLRILQSHRVFNHRRGYICNPESIAHCRDLVQHADVEGYLCLAFYPKEIRQHILAIKAFNVEVAKAADKSSNEKMTEIRLQWWRSVIEKLPTKQLPTHPVVDALCETFHKYDLDMDLLYSLVDKRIQDLNVKIPETLYYTEEYAEGTQGALLKLALKVLGAHTVPGNVKAAHQVGTAVGISMLMRGTKFHAQRNKVYIPRELASTCQLSISSLTRCEPSPELARCMQQMAILCREYLDEAKKNAWTKEALPVLYSASIARAFLNRLDSLDYDIMHPSWQYQGGSLIRVQIPLMIMKNRILGTF
uniref:15-cis-phytoene synthase n=1 Tax=Guillardia theta TaxID=55529 RepID=A0A7S4K6T9_GUITH|mmetsp:Transcript_21599/g.71517  ORF Transcript_21599/g.71517 Transcript_21599/m.71517 type:complete len:315 (+) Transcript_21599:97-1041(+)